MNQKIMVALLTALLSVPLCAYAVTGPSLILKDIKIAPNIYPGDAFNVSFRIENAWHSDMREVYVYLEGGYPLLNSSPTEPYYFRYLGYEYLGKTSDRVTFDLAVDKSAAAGFYTVNAVLTYRRFSDTAGAKGGYERYVDTIPLLIEVKGTPSVEIFVKGSKPSEIKANDEAEVQLKVVNIGTEDARNVLIFPKSIKEIDVMWFSEAVYVGDISPQGSSTVPISIEAKEGISAGDYSLPVGIFYQTPRGENVTASGKIDVTIKESADFSVSSIANGVSAGEKEKPVSFSVKNTGSATADDVKVILRANYPFTPTGNEFFVGALSPGEEKEVGFHVDVDSDSSPQRYPVDLIVQWKEDSSEYTKTKSAFIDVSKVAQEVPMYILSYVGIFLVLLILVRILKRR